jgi:phosphohistidine swiveling domain-containing protein
MSFWRRLFRTLRPPRADQSLKLMLTRLRRLNRCYREFLGLFVDAAEKQGEGFILDRQYIVSLVEQAFRLGYEIIFHTNVLRPGIALAGYTDLDRLKTAIRDLLAGERRPLEDRLTVNIAENDESLGENVGDRAAGHTELGNRPAVPAPAPEISPSRLREARRHRVRLIENEGYVAAPGVASGRVSLVKSEADLHAFPEHGVLVAPWLEPTAALLRTLPRVAAILVEAARPTDRIAILARSFRVPTLLGVPGATMRLPPGELVTVDATDAVVYSGVFDELILHHHLHGGSRGEEPEYRLLNGVLWEVGSPLCTTALPGAPPEDRQTLCGTVRSVYTATLCQLVAGLLSTREGIPVRSPGFSEGIRMVDLSTSPTGADGEAPGMSGMPDPSAWVLAGLAAAGDDGETTPPASDAHGLLYRLEESTTALLLGGEGVVWLDAVVAGGAEGNHVMVCGSAGSGSSPENGLDWMYAEAVRLGLVAVRAARTVAAWGERIPPGSVRDILTRLGQLAHQTALGTGAARWAAG